MSRELLMTGVATLEEMTMERRLEIINEQEILIAYLNEQIANAEKLKNEQMKALNQHVLETKTPVVGKNWQIVFVKGKNRTDWDPAKLKELCPKEILSRIFVTEEKVVVSERLLRQEATNLAKSGELPAELVTECRIVKLGVDYTSLEPIERAVSSEEKSMVKKTMQNKSIVLMPARN